MGLGDHGADRDGNWLRGDFAVGTIGRSEQWHLAVSVEDGAGFNDETRGLNVAGHDRATLNFDLAARLNRSTESTGNQDNVRYDATLSDGVLGQDQCIRGDQACFESTVNAKGAGGLELAV